MVREEMFKEVVNNHDSLIKATVFKKIGNGTPDWEDVVGNIYLSIWVALDKFENRSSIKTFIYPIIQRRIADYLRYKYKESRRMETFNQLVKVSHLHGLFIYSGNKVKKKEKQRLNEPDVVDKLSHAEFKVFKFVGQGLTNDELSEKLFISKDTVRSHLKKINSKLSFDNRVKLALFANNFLNGGIK